MSLSLTTTSPAASILHPATEGAAEWWRNAVIYQVYPRSFADGNGDGIGDLKGITERLDHLVDLGVDALWLSPFYKSPQADAGYDVSDYRQIDPIFGDLDDFAEMSTKAHKLGLKVIIDLVPNHTSDDHAWFKEAIEAGPGSAARDRYMFREGKGENGELPPNNWQSIFGGPAWTRVDQRWNVDADGVKDTEWYLHMFDTRQPDLNWQNEEVREDFKSILRFWLDRGVDGFRIDVAHGMVKAEGLPDWDGTTGMVDGTKDEGKTQVQTDGTPDEDGSNGGGNSGPMFDQDGVHEIYRSWHEVMEQYDGDRALVAEAWVEPLSRLALYVREDEMQQAFNFSFLTTKWDAAAMRTVISASVRENDVVGAPTTWVLSNHDVVRHVTRLGLPAVVEGREMNPNGVRATDPQPDVELGLRRAKAATLQMLGLPGSAYLYNGEEFGTPDHTEMPDEYRQDPAFERKGRTEAGRDGCRVPLAWEADKPAYGFSTTGKSWLPQPETYRAVAADVQKADPNSTFHLYKNVLRLRREHNIGLGSLAWLDDFASSTEVIAYQNGDVIVVTNFADAPFALPAGAEILASSEPLVDGAVGTDVCVWIKSA
ncbi:alpha-amylase family glycosyl hydrolase [Timonella senegalensis]|uniref:glycoside hydrolase family 13 protein n=1 Tax=Timonella senegalensis TaxID=1465825 RepID=UPI0028A5DD08|nr:alpha-amylase family glycosyl hydrolase [Timonella senegalensis]